MAAFGRYSGIFVIVFDAKSSNVIEIGWIVTVFEHTCGKWINDGNGRIHRFLLHHVLARRSFGLEGIILPASAVILNRPREYDQALESFSKPLMERVEYTLDDRLRMTVTNDTVDFYRYFDCTELTRITIGFIREAIETELPSELR